jgi:predicted transcriptional regulator
MVNDNNKHKHFSDPHRIELEPYQYGDTTLEQITLERTAIVTASHCGMNLAIGSNNVFLGKYKFIEYNLVALSSTCRYNCNWRLIIMATSQGIKLDDATQARLKSLAAKRDRSPHWIMRTAIENYLTQEEHYEKEKAEDMAAYEEYVLTGKGIDNKTVQAWLQDLADGKNTPCPK